jgi:hypothetical protein
VALAPLLAVVAALAWQAVLAGEAYWLAGIAARAGARAEAVSGTAAAGARSALPGRLRRDLRVRVSERGAVEVAVRVPPVLGVDLGAVHASAALESQR